MKCGKKEGGYSLVIVLFTIVFIMTITAVFMRGALSNVKQEQTVDKNNLTVVVAEAGVDYYTWELEEYFDEIKGLVYKEIREDAIKESKEKNKLINFKDVQLEIANALGIEMDDKIKELVERNESFLFNGYNHYLKANSSYVVGDFRGALLPLKINAISSGRRNDENIADKSLNFEMVFLIPNLDSNVNDDVIIDPGETPEAGTDDKWLVIRTPQSPKIPTLPKKVEGISKPMEPCPATIDIYRKECHVINNKSVEFKLRSSTVFGNGSFESTVSADLQDSALSFNNQFKSKGIKMQNSEMISGSVIDEGITDLQGSSATIDSTFNTRGFKIQKGDISIGSKLSSAYLDLQNVKLSAGDITSEQTFKATSSDITVIGLIETQATDFQNVAINVGGNYTSRGVFKAQESDVKIGGKFTASNGSDIQKSNLEVLGDYESSVKFDVQESDIFVRGALTAGSGSDLQTVTLKVGNSYTSPQKFKAQNSQIYINNDMKAGSGSDLQNVNMKIGGVYNTPQSFKVQNSDISVAEKVDAGSGSDLQGVNMFIGGDFVTPSITKWQGTRLNVIGNITATSGTDIQNSYIKANDFNSNPLLKASGGVISVNSIKSDRADLQNVTVCVKDLNVRDLKYPGTKIYYSNSSNHTGNNIKQIPEEEFSKVCKFKDLPGGGGSEPETPSLELPPVLPPTTIKVEEVTYN